jgi:hypothetical protein
MFSMSPPPSRTPSPAGPAAAHGSPEPPPLGSAEPPLFGNIYEHPRATRGIGGGIHSAGNVAGMAGLGLLLYTLWQRYSHRCVDSQWNCGWCSLFSLFGKNERKNIKRKLYAYIFLLFFYDFFLIFLKKYFF